MAIINVTTAAGLTTAVTGAAAGNGTTIAANGDTVVISNASLVIPAGGFLVDKQVRIEGAHITKNQIQSGTKLTQASANEHGLVLRTENITLVNLILKGPRNAIGDPAGTGCGILMMNDSGGTPLGTNPAIKMEDVYIWGFGQDGLLGDTGGSIDGIILRDCVFVMNGRHGFYVKNTHAGKLFAVISKSNLKCGYFLENCSGWTMLAAEWEQNWSTPGSTDFDAQFYIKDGWGHVMMGCLAELCGRIVLTVDNHDGFSTMGHRFQNADRGIVLRNTSRGARIHHGSWRAVTDKFDIPNRFASGADQAFIDWQADPP